MVDEAAPVTVHCTAPPCSYVSGVDLGVVSTTLASLPRRCLSASLPAPLQVNAPSRSIIGLGDSEDVQKEVVFAVYVEFKNTQPRVHQHVLQRGAGNLLMTELVHHPRIEQEGHARKNHDDTCAAIAQGGRTQMSII